MTELPNDLPSLDALRRNDPAAWDRVFLWLSPEAQKAAWFPLSGFPEQDVREVASDAMAKLVDAVPTIDRVESLLPRIKAIAKNLAIDHQRRADAAKRGRALGSSLEAMREESGDAHMPSSADRPDLEVQRTERRSDLERALKKLKPPLMELIVGFYIMGLSYDELARNHRMAAGSVGPSLYRGIAQLRSEISNDPTLDGLRLSAAILASLLPFLLAHL